MLRRQPEFAATCGLYCGACPIRQAGQRGDLALLKQIAEVLTVQQGQPIEAKDLACEGCLSSDVVAIVCRSCELRACALKRGVQHCSQCPDFPCQPLVDFSKDGFPHHGEALENIRRQRQAGLDVWLEDERARWRCPRCGADIDWYNAQCCTCSAELTPQFSPSEIPGAGTSTSQ
jgi:hypothetical protein